MNELKGVTACEIERNRFLSEFELATHSRSTPSHAFGKFMPFVTGWRQYAMTVDGTV